MTPTTTRALLAFGVATLVASVLSGCFCTKQRTIVQSPAVVVEVVDQESGEPVEGARVKMCRIQIGPPPSEVLDRWETRTDADGRASFAGSTTSETVMPLMMHGVPQRGWELCVEHDEYAMVTSARDGGYLLVESMSEGETPRELPRQTVELPSKDSGSYGCPCDTVPDR